MNIHAIDRRMRLIGGWCTMMRLDFLFPTQFAWGHGACVKSTEAKRLPVGNAMFAIDSLLVAVEIEYGRLWPSDWIDRGMMHEAARFFGKISAACAAISTWKLLGETILFSFNDKKIVESECTFSIVFAFRDFFLRIISACAQSCDDAGRMEYERHTDTYTEPRTNQQHFGKDRHENNLFLLWLRVVVFDTFCVKETCMSRLFQSTIATASATSKVPNSVLNRSKKIHFNN